MLTHAIQRTLTHRVLGFIFKVDTGAARNVPQSLGMDGANLDASIGDHERKSRPRFPLGEAIRLGEYDP
jgi:hypothetical protein